MKTGSKSVAVRRCEIAVTEVIVEEFLRVVGGHRCPIREVDGRAVSAHDAVHGEAGGAEGSGVG